MLADIKPRPVVQARPATGFFIDVETEGMDEVQGRSHSHARAPDVPGVVRDLGLVQDDVEERGLHAKSVPARGDVPRAGSIQV